MCENNKRSKASLKHTSAGMHSNNGITRWVMPGEYLRERQHPVSDKVVLVGIGQVPHEVHLRDVGPVQLGALQVDFHDMRALPRPYYLYHILQGKAVLKLHSPLFCLLLIVFFWEVRLVKGH